MKRLMFAAALAVLLAAPASAAPIDFDAAIKGADGQTMTDGSPEKVELTLGRAAAMSLLASYPDDTAVPADEKLRRGLLGLRVYQGKTIDLPTGDIELIKKYIAKAYGPLVIARAAALLDPAAVK